MQIGFIGMGRVGKALANAVAQCGLTVAAVHARNPAHAAALGALAPDAQIAASAQVVADACDLVFLTVNDDAIGPVCTSLQWRAGQFVVHCSGATDVEVLDHAKQAGAHIGGFHPLMAFADPALALQNLPGCTVAIEAAAPLDALLADLAARLACVPLTLPAGSRALYHASAHYAGAFINALLGDAVAMWQHFGASEAQALAALVPLARSSLANAQSQGLVASLPGVISRGDLGTLQKHLLALAAMPTPVGQLYRDLARRNVPMALERGSITAEQAARLLATLA